MEEILELYELQYSDLVALSSDRTPATVEETERLELISESIMQNLGRNGPGLLSVNGVPKTTTLAQTLLPLARKLALLNSEDRKRILQKHNLGSDVSMKNLDRIVSSFAMQMNYDHDPEFNFKTKVEEDGSEFNDLGFAFRELGFIMMELGISLARVCDKSIGGRELEQSLLQRGTAKGRLIHYHSFADNIAIKARKYSADVKSENSGESNLWQQWHYDYGIFTVLTSPIFMFPDGNKSEGDSSSLCGNTFLQVFHPETKRVLKVRASEGSFIVQVGESGDVLSKGRLRATLHSVFRPVVNDDDLSRETFVVFLQPAWNKVFSLSDYPDDLMSVGREKEECNEDGLSGKIGEVVPPLFSRLRDGMTFAEFSRETTKKYYGGSGLQSNRLDLSRERVDQNHLQSEKG